MPLTPCVFIYAEGTTQLAGSAATAFFKGPAKDCAGRQAIATCKVLARATVEKFLPHLIVKPLGPFHPVAKRLAFLPWSMVTGRALKTPEMQPQGNWTIQHGQIADTPGSAIFDPSAAPLASRANEVSVSALEMQFQLVGPDDLIGHTEFG
jgi:hypothetical protein